MDALQKLAEVLEQRGALLARLPEPAVQCGLRQLAGLLQAGLDLPGDSQDVGLARWSKQQWEYVLAVLEALVPASCDLVLDSAEKEVLEQVHALAVRFSLRGLEHNVRQPHTITTALSIEEIQLRFLQLLDMLLVEGKARERGPPAVEYLASEVPPFDLPCSISEADISVACINSTSEVVSSCNINEAGSSGSLMMLLASEQPVHEFRSTGTDGTQAAILLNPVTSILAATHKFAIVEAHCVSRLLDICRSELSACLMLDSDEEDRLAQGKASFVSSILKLLVQIARDSAFEASDKDVTLRLVELASAVPVFLKLTRDVSNADTEDMLENDQAFSLPAILEGLLQVAEIVLPDQTLYFNLRTYLAVSILDALELSKARHDISLAGQQLPLACTPHVVSHLLGMIEDVHAHSLGRYQVHARKGEASKVVDSGDRGGILLESLSVELSKQSFFLDRGRSQQEHMEILFPDSTHWLENIVAVTSLLHAQGLKVRPFIDTASSVQSEEELATGSVDCVTVASEDDALFGDLFSESGRNSVNSDGNTQGCSSTKKLDGLYNTPLQTAFQVLTFLRECIFFPDWHRSTFDTACKQITKEHVDVLLQILFSRSNFTDRGLLADESADGEGSSDLLSQLHKGSFDLIHALILRSALSDALEVHLAHQILKEADTPGTLSMDSLALLANLLVHRSTKRKGDSYDDPVILETWKNFTDSLILKGKSLKMLEMNVEKAAASLPSVVHMEVLFTGFHSLTVQGRIRMFRSLLLSLKSFHVCEKQNNIGNALAVSSLLISRLVLAMRYLVLQFNTFPRWLLAHMRENIKHQPIKAVVNFALDDGPVASWSAQIARSVLKDRRPGEHHLDEVSIHQLLDIGATADPSGFLEAPEISGLQRDLSDLSHCLGDILETWRGKTLNTVDEVILERYIFLLVWSIMCSVGPALKPATTQELASYSSGLLGADFFMNVGRIFNASISQDSSLNAKDWFSFLIKILSAVEGALLDGKMKNLMSWDFLRQNASSHLLLSSLQAGLWAFSAKNILKGENVVGGDQSVIINNERGLLKLFEESAVTIFQDAHSTKLVSILSSMLQWYVNALRSCLLQVLRERDPGSKFLVSLDLLLRGCLSKGKQQDLLGRAGLSTSVSSLLRWGSSSTWLAETLSLLFGPDHDKGDPSDPNHIFLPALLHGFPSTCHPGSAAIVSCMLLIESIIDTLQGVLNCQGTMLGVSVKLSDFNDLRCTLQAVMLDSTVENLHSKCSLLLSTLVPSKVDLTRISDMYLLKHLGEVLLLKGVDAGVKEMVAVQAVEIINSIRSDVARFEALRLYFQETDSDNVRKHSGSQAGEAGANSKSFSCLVDVLAGCSSEVVNLKVMQLMIDLLNTESIAQSGFKEDLQRKFLSMPLPVLAGWLEQRLLGQSSDVSDGVPARSAHSAVRDLAAVFVQALLSSEGKENDHTSKLRSHVVDAMLLNLDKAFLIYEVMHAKLYFSLVVQLAAGERLLSLVLRPVVDLLGKMPVHTNNLEGLKCLLSFLRSVFAECGVRKANLTLNSGHGLSTLARFGSAGLKAKQSIFCKNTDQLLQPPIESGGGSGECDATSVDDDEDDGTSDGELVSLDRDDEDDAGSTERALASRVCTFTSSGSNFMEQHWYFCYTCDLTVSKGCCSVCAKVCHRGHKVVYSRLSRFFCDCGAGGVRGTSCLCLKPRKYVPPAGTGTAATSSSVPDPFMPLASQHVQVPQSDSDSEMEEEEHLESDSGFKISIFEREDRKLLALLADLDVEGQILSLCKRLAHNLSLGLKVATRKEEEVVLGDAKIMAAMNDLHLKRAYKSGSLDMKIKAEYSNARELKSHLVSGSIVKSLLSVSSRGRLAAGEGDKVTIFDVGQLIGQPTAIPVTVDKTTVKPLSRNAVRFEIAHLAFNSANESYLAVAGFEDCQIFTVNPRGEVTDRLAVELALQDAHIRRIAWVPGSQVQLLVVTNKFVKIYDLSQDKISPTHYFTVIEDSIADATVVPVGQGRLAALVLSHQGVLYSQHVGVGVESGSRILTENIQIPEMYKPVKGISLCYSAAQGILLLSYSDGTSLIGRLSPDATGVLQVSSLYEVESDGKKKPAGLHHWRETFEGSGLFVCLSSLKSNSAVGVHVGSVEVQSQYLRGTGTSAALRVDGMTAYRPMTKDRHNILLLHDDGSLQVYAFTPPDDAAGFSLNLDTQRHSSTLEADQVKKLGAVLLGHRTGSGAPPVFPLDFFEKTTCITPEVKLGGDILRNSDSEGIKMSLASEDGFLEGPSASGFRIAVLNLNPEQVMVGCRVHVGNTSASHIPSELRVFQRTIRLEEGVRCWYDMPFTNSEALLADEEFTLTVGPTFNASSLPRIDNLEVYGRSKDEFGWKEKLDALLDMESQGAAGSVAGPGAGLTKHRLLHSGSTPEHVFSGILRLLAGYYLANRLQSASDAEDARLIPSRKNCLAVLEVIFETDRQPLLQSAARHLLRALYPAKDAYYQAKDTMRLAGVARSCPLLASSVSAGGSATSWVVQEFSAQMRSVCKIALHRQSNLAGFLEQNGSSVVDGLVQVLWEILTREQLDAQSINNLVIPMVDLIYSYAECLTMHGGRTAPAEAAIVPAVALLHKLLFAPYEAVRTSCSLAISSRLLQVPLPKQTMLAMDDVGDSSRTTSSPLETANGTVNSGQVMVEEDPNTASVQYCCDGCSTVPILRRRWHCNVCPDFDLCEGCYEVMDGDQLPPPHTRDHPMSAIPIELDTGGGDSGEMHFSAIDELSDESLLQMATELSLQSTGSPPLISGVEMTNNRGLVHAVLEESKGVIFSASKNAVNSLLLHRLVEDMQGWMRVSSGAQAVPVMQLFYRLASATSGPLVDTTLNNSNLTLEKLIKLLIQEMDLTTPLSVKVRSNFGEVIVLIFMFFTLVLRNWHQPGSDHSQSRAGPTGSDPATALPFSGSSSPCPSEGLGTSEGGSQLDKACGALRQQALVSYLLSVVQQLSNYFKNSTRSSESSPAGAGTAACGALLTVRREFASGSFTPFFSDSYAKAHRGDLFGDFHRLLLESAFRLTYSLIRPEKSEKGADREQSARSCANLELKLEGWQEVLCSYINNPQTTFIRKYARKLLLHMCGTKGHYYSVRDAWQLSREVKRLNKLAQKSGGFQVPVVYERSVKLVKCLSVIVDVAGARPRNWQKYCSRHIDVLQFLLNAVFSFGEESVVQTLKLLKLMFYTGKDLGGTLVKGTALEPFETPNPAGKSGIQAVSGKKKRKGGSDESLSSASTGEKIYLDMEAGVDQLAAEDGKILRQFIDKFLLEWNASSVRSEAKAVVYGAWHHGRNPFRMLMLTLLLDKVPVLPSYGQNIAEYTDLLTWLLGKGVSESGQNSQEVGIVQGCLNGDVVKKIYRTLCIQNELLANHPNSRIYNTLATLVEFDGYYLESEPCLACSSPEVPYTRMKLDSLKSETKFTDNRILVKCVGSHTIQSVTMNVHDARRSKSVKVLNLYYNNRAVADLSELKNNWSLWKRARCCQLAFNQTELKVEFPIPITACNFMIELDSFYENLQASSLESLQCPRCSRFVTDKHGICSNCHENAYQCRQCRNINYENLDSFLCNECGYSKYGRFEFNFMAKPSFTFDSMENDEDMKKGLAAIEAESENAHRRYQQLLGFKKPLLKLVSSIGETEMDSQQKDSVQQMIVSLPGSSSFKINRKIAILGVLYGEKCKMAFDSVSKSVQTLQGLRRVLMSYLERKKMMGHVSLSMVVPARPPNRCFGCANTFVGQCLEWLQVLARQQHCRQELVGAGILRELFENNIHQGPKAARVQARAVLCALTEGDVSAVDELNNLIKQKVMYCLEHHRSMDIASCVRDELQLLSESCSSTDDYWEARLRVVFQLLFRSIQLGARHPVIAEHIILPCLRIVSHACTPPKQETEPGVPPPTSRPEPRADDSVKTSPIVPTIVYSKPVPGSFEKDLEQETKSQDFPLINYVEWKNGATYLDFVRRQFTVTQTSKPIVAKVRKDPKRADYLALKCMLKWKRKACKLSVTDELAAFEESSWVHELVLSACSQAIRSEMSGLIEVLCSQSATRRSRFLNLLMTLLPATRAAGESAAEYFELLFKMIEPEEARLYLTVRGFLRTACGLISEEVKRIEAQEHSFHTDISQGYILHKLIELLNKFLQVPNIRSRFMKEELLAPVLEALLAIRGLIVQKTKLTGDCGRLLRELLDSLLQESYENKHHFIRACISGLQTHRHDRRDRTSLFILEQLCNIICPSKPEPAYMMVLNKSHTQEEFIRGSMTKSPYSSLEIGPLMRDVKNKICHQLELVGLLEDDYGMELLVAGNIIALDLSVAQVYEQVWRKAHTQAGGSTIGASLLAAAGSQAPRECPPMAITYRLQGLDGEATEPMIKELEDDREESQDPEVEFAIAGAMQEYGGLEIVLSMVQQLSDDDIKPGQEEFVLVLKLLMYCCKIRANRQALLRIGALSVLLETARRAFSNDAAEPAEGLLLIVESLVTEANEGDVGMMESTAMSSSKSRDGTDEPAASAVLMFLERLSHPATASKSNKQQRNHDTVARILPYLTYGDQTAMELLVKYFIPYLKDWGAFDRLQKQHRENVKDEGLGHDAAEHQLALDNFVRVTESIKLNPNGEKLKSLIMEKAIIKGAVRYLKDAFPPVGRRADYKATPEWTRGLEMPSIPIILLMLSGLSKGHKLTQRCLDEEGVLPLLHALEGVSGENEIGARAENLLDTLTDKDGTGGGFLSDKVAKLRHATRDEMRRRALRKREELLQGLGMRRELRSDGGERIVVSKPIIEGLEEIEEEEAGLACMVCREGYRLRPTDMLGAYCYSKRVNLAYGIGGSKAEWVYTTVSHFNVIHFQCHQEAKRADASLKNPKKEWEGAALRNSETLCNNLFPLRGPAVPLAQYARCVDHHWDNLNALGRADGSRLRLLIYDIVLMLGRFATGASFSVDSKGGGRESNSRLVPFMIQMARHLLDQGGASQRRIQAKALALYVSPSLSSFPDTAGESIAGFKPATPTTPPASRAGAGAGSSDETVQFMMVQSLLLQSLDDWLQHRRTFLQRGIVHAYAQHKQGRSVLPHVSSLTPASLTPSPLRNPPTTAGSESVTPSRGSSAAESSIPRQSVSGSEDARDGESRIVTVGNVISRSQLFLVLHPMLVYIGLVDRMQHYFKKGPLGSKSSSRTVEEADLSKDLEQRRSSTSGASETSGGAESPAANSLTGHCGIEPWEAIMKEKLKDVSSMLGLAKELLEWLEEMQNVEDVQEALDVMGALGDAFATGCTSCDDFVCDAINTGSNLPGGPLTLR